MEVKKIYDHIARFLPENGEISKFEIIEEDGVVNVKISLGNSDCEKTGICSSGFCYEKDDGTPKAKGPGDLHCSDGFCKIENDPDFIVLDSWDIEIPEGQTLEQTVEHLKKAYSSVISQGSSVKKDKFSEVLKRTVDVFNQTSRRVDGETLSHLHRSLDPDATSGIKDCIGFGKDCPNGAPPKNAKPIKSPEEIIAEAERVRKSTPISSQTPEQTQDMVRSWRQQGLNAMEGSIRESLHNTSKKAKGIQDLNTTRGAFVRRGSELDSELAKIRAEKAKLKLNLKDIEDKEANTIKTMNEGVVKEDEKTTRVVNRKQPFSKIKDCDELGCFPNTCPNNGPNFVGNLQENQVRSYKTMNEGVVKKVEKTTREQLEIQLRAYEDLLTKRNALRNALGAGKSAGDREFDDITFELDNLTFELDNLWQAIDEEWCPLDLDEEIRKQDFLFRRKKVMGSKVTMEDLETKPSSFRRDSYHKAEEKANTDTKEKLDELQSVEKDVLNYLELTRSFVNRNVDKAVGFVNELSKLKERETLAIKLKKAFEHKP